MILNTEHRKCSRDEDMRELGHLEVSEDRLVELLHGNKVCSRLNNLQCIFSTKFRFKWYVHYAVSVEFLIRVLR